VTEKPRIYVFAGPNGAGKTTFANVLLPRFLQVDHFVNADTIARVRCAWPKADTTCRRRRLEHFLLGEDVRRRYQRSISNTLSLYYHTPLVGEHNGRLAYIDPHKYSLEDIRAGFWKSDPGIYEWHAAAAG